jgi:hypothetical protein
MDYFFHANQESDSLCYLRGQLTCREECGLAGWSAGTGNDMSARVGGIHDEAFGSGNNIKIIGSRNAFEADCEEGAAGSGANGGCAARRGSLREADEGGCGCVAKREAESAGHGAVS